MTYVYCLLISLGVNVLSFGALVLALKRAAKKMLGGGGQKWSFGGSSVRKVTDAAA